MRRLDMKIQDAVHIAILNLTLKNVKKFHHLSNEILPFLREVKKSILGTVDTFSSNKPFACTIITVPFQRSPSLLAP